MEKELKPVETITPYEAGRLMHANAEQVRAGLRGERLPFINWGMAVPPKKAGGHWKYKIIKSKFLEFIGEEGECL